MGHAVGAAFHVPHGRAVGLFLPYTIEFSAREAPERFGDLARLLGFAQTEGEEAARILARQVRSLIRHIGNPSSVAEMGIEQGTYEARIETLIDNAFNDTQMVTAPRSPS
jgi:alcohol dehydrogenase class IV